MRDLTEDERKLLQHVITHGSDSVLVKYRRAGSWTYDFRSIHAPTVWKTKRAAREQLQRYLDALHSYDVERSVENTEVST